MKKPTAIALARDEEIVACVPQYVSGPGWANAPVWVYIRSGSGMRSVCIQPMEQSSEMHTLFAAGAAMCSALKNAVPVKRKMEPAL
jgi:hypothetical protein